LKDYRILPQMDTDSHSAADAATTAVKFY